MNRKDSDIAWSSLVLVVKS